MASDFRPLQRWPSQNMRDSSVSFIDADSDRVYPLVYREGERIVAVALWFADGIEDRQRKVILEGLRGKDQEAWVAFLMFADTPEFWDRIPGVIPPDIEQYRPCDLGVVLCGSHLDDPSKAGFFCFNNAPM